MKKHPRRNRWNLFTVIASLVAVASMSLTNAVAVTSSDVTTGPSDVLSEDSSSKEVSSTRTGLVGTRLVTTDKNAIIHGKEWVMGLPVGTSMYVLESIPGERESITYYRVWLPDYKFAQDSVYYLKLDISYDAVHPIFESYPDGYFLGDLDGDERLSVFDLCLMRRLVIDGTSTKKELALADLSGDHEIGVSDLVLMQKFLLADEDHFYPENFSKTIAQGLE